MPAKVVELREDSEDLFGEAYTVTIYNPNGDEIKSTNVLSTRVDGQYVLYHFPTSRGFTGQRTLFGIAKKMDKKASQRLYEKAREIAETMSKDAGLTLVDFVEAARLAQGDNFILRRIYKFCRHLNSW